MAENERNEVAEAIYTLAAAVLARGNGDMNSDQAAGFVSEMRQALKDWAPPPDSYRSQDLPRPFVNGGVAASGSYTGDVYIRPTGRGVDLGNVAFEDFLARVVGPEAEAHVQSGLDHTLRARITVEVLPDA